MCGIAGFVLAEPQVIDPLLIERMTTSLAHRGPDGFGYYRGEQVALGHRRLAILDPVGGSQPLSNEDGTVWVTYNGEIYNEPGLRRRLEASGHLYRTRTDTESLVHLYEEQGADLVRGLNGMFAMAIWDTRHKRLILARDPFGQKPLYYAELDDGGLVFASEPKALLQHPAVPRWLHHASLARYLFYEYVPAPNTIWEGIKRLPAGHVLSWEEGRHRLVRYWSAPAAQDDGESIDAAAQRFWGLFETAVERHLRSDVPLGVFLSGGIDSSCVATAMCAGQPPAAVHTFSIGFEDPSFDESMHARVMARHLGTNHHERLFSAQELLDLLPAVAGWMDEPFGDASLLPTHLLSRFAREQVTVALGGDGADEQLAGYPTFAAEHASAFYQRLPALARALIAAAAARLPVDHRNFSPDFKIKQFLRGADAPPALAHQRWLGSFHGLDIAALLQHGPLPPIEDEHCARAAGLAPDADPLSRSLRLYQELYLADDILTKVDRASMACSLEVRSPFLDLPLAHAIARLPAAHKQAWGRGKRLLRRAAANRLPPSILKRGKKGFGIPVARWINGPLAELINDLLSSERLQRQGLFRPAAVAQLLRDHRLGRLDNRKPIWTLLMFQLWYEIWLCPGQASPTPPFVPGTGAWQGPALNA